MSVAKKPFVYFVLCLFFTVKTNGLNHDKFLLKKPKHSLQRSESSEQWKNKCTPKIKLLNCGANPSDMPRYSPYKSFIILSNVDVDKSCKLLRRITLTWEVWLVGKDKNRSEQRQELAFINKRSFLVKEGSLYYGVYRVKLKTKAIYSNSILSKNSYCYFKIVPLPVQAVIVGGSKKQIYYKNPIHLEVLTLVAPDVCEPKQGIGNIPPQKTIYEWKCNGGDEFCAPFKTTNSFRDIFGRFSRFKEYNFSLNFQTVENKAKPQNQQSAFQVILMGAANELEISIDCMINCGDSIFKSNPQEIIHLEAKVRGYKGHPESIIYHWNYSFTDSNETVEDVMTIREKGTPGNLFVVKKNKLIKSKKYTFSVHVQSSYSAELIVQTCELPKNPNCTIFPEGGIRGETFFKINCSTSKQQRENFLSLTHEFFDRYSNESLGRYLGVSSTGILDGIVLTRGQLFVRTFNMFGAYIETFVDVKLSPFTQNMTVEHNLPRNQMLGQYMYRIGLITAYGDYLNFHPSSPNLTNVLLTMLTAEKGFVEEITGATLLISALHNIFCNTSNKAQYLKSNTVQNVAKIMHHVSEILKNTMTDTFESYRYITTTRVLDIANYILFCASDLLDSYDHYYNAMVSKVNQDLKVSAFYIMESLNNVLTAVAFKVLMFNRFTHFGSKLILLMLEYLEPNSENLPFSSKSTRTSVNATGVCMKNFPGFYAQAINFAKLPFWWKTNLLGEINTNIVVSQFKHGMDKVPEVKSSKANILGLVVIDFKPSTIFGSVKQPNPKHSPDINDFIVAVHRIAPPVNSKTFVQFLGIEGNSTLRAILLQDLRPDYDFLNSNPMIITNKSSSLNLSMIKSNNELFLYLGIIPGVEVKIGETVNYTFHLFTASCKVRRYQSWMTGSKCKVSDETTRVSVICACFLNTFTLGGQIFVPEHDLNPFSNIPLLVTVYENPFPITLITVVMLLFVILLVWMIRKDKRNKRKVNLIVLEDNDKRDTCGYLVGVFTGSRIRAGTTSNVAIILLGEEGMSRSHVLKSQFRPTLQSNCDDWFLLFTHHHLGSLTKIIIWMDYFGPRPHWYCSKIFVCDLRNYDTDTFIIEKWFGINIQEINLKMVQECATYKEINNKFRLVSENLENGLRENHLLWSLFFRHPRSLVNSSQRLAAVFCMLFVIIGTSVIIYFITSPNMEDFTLYSISKETLVNGVVSGLVGNMFYFITLHFFKSSYKLVPAPTDYHKHVDDATMYHLERQYSAIVADPVWLQKLKYIISYINPCQVIPVQMDKDDFSGIKVNRRKQFFVYFLCIVISVLSIHLSIICGMRFGEIKSYTWLSSVIIAIIQTACVTFPLKIIVTSLVFAVSKKRYFPLMSHTIGFSENVGGYLIRRTIEDINEHSVTRKSLLETTPSLQNLSERELKKKQTRVRVIWTSLYIFGCLVFLGNVCWLILGFNLNELCIMNHSVCNEIDTKESCQTSKYSNIKNYREFLETIQNKMLPVLYSTNWYNGENKTLPTESFTSSGWLDNEMSRLIGPPRLRQIRVKNVFYCNTPKLMMINCSGSFTPLNKQTEDKTQYNTGWVINDWVDCQFDQTSWYFQDARKTLGTDIRTRSGFVCHGGGYISSLGGTENDAKLTIRNIIDTNWVDKYTRVLILEFTTYNVNKDVFTSVMVFAEATPFGSVETFHKIYSMQLSVFPASGIVFLAYFLVFGVRILVLMNIMGIGNFCMNLWNLQEIVILISYFVSVIYYVQFLILSKMYRENVDKQGKDIFFQVQKLTAEIVKLKDTISVLFCLAAFRMLRIIRFNADVRQYLHDLHLAIKGIVWIWVVLSLFIFVQWRFIMFLVAPPPGDSFKDILVYQSDFRIIVHQYKHSHSKLLAFLLSLLTQIGMFSYVCSLTHYYRKGQLKRNPPVNRASILTNRRNNFLYSRIWESSFY